MSNAWNLKFIRRLAGLPQQETAQLNEDFDQDDDDEDPDVKIANADKRQSTFEKRNKKELKSADKEASTLKKKPAAKAEPKKEEPKAAPAKAEPEAKKEEPAAEDKKRGRAPSDDSKSGQARSWLSHEDNKGHTRGGFIKHATANLGMSAHHANTFYYAHKKKTASGDPVKEAYVLFHPHLPGFMLAENREMNQMQWIDPSSPLEPFIFETEAEAQHIAKYMAEWKSQMAVVTKVSFND